MVFSPGGLSYFTFCLFFSCPVSLSFASLLNSVEILSPQHSQSCCIRLCIFIPLHCHDCAHELLRNPFSHNVTFCEECIYVWCAVAHGTTCMCCGCIHFKCLSEMYRVQLGLWVVYLVFTIDVQCELM